PVTVIEADRIEDITQHTRHGQQADRPALDVYPGPAQIGLDLRPQRPARAIAVIPVMKGQKVEAIAREQTQPPIQGVDLSQVQQQPEHAVVQPMLARPKPPVGDNSAIKGRTIGHAVASSTLGADMGRWMRPLSFSTAQGLRTPPNCSATASPDCRPSS